MQKRKSYTNRLDALFTGVGEALPEPPEDLPGIPAPDPGKQVMPWIETEPGPTAQDAHSQSEPGIRGSGWEDYLDGIHRDEQVRFEVTSEDPANRAGGAVLCADLDLGSGRVGRIELEAPGGKTWTDEQAALVNSVTRQMTQHLENLRLLAQAGQYRGEAEQAARMLTREGWQEYLSARPAMPSGYVYDRNRVAPLTEAGLPESLEGSIVQPIAVREEQIGELVVSVESDQARDLLRDVATRLGTHIESLRLLEETELSRQQLDRRAAELETVARVSTAAATILDPQTLLQSVVDLTRASFKLYHVQVYLLEDSDTQLNLMANSSRVGEATFTTHHVIGINENEFVVARVARTRKAVMVRDTQAESDYSFYPNLSEARSELAVPLLVGDQLVGVFCALASTPNRFTESDTRTYITLASQVAVALRNAELYAHQIATVERLRELDHLKSSFLANMSHELRTPLNSILGFSQVILEGLDGPLTEDMNNDLQLIEKNGRHLLNLINDVLDMSKIEAGRMNLSFDTFDLRDLIQDVLETTSSLARDRALYLRLEIAQGDTLLISADRFRLRQILLNLVGNSIKFTERGGITVYAAQEGASVRIRIRDTGIGIPPDKLETVFEAFSQVDTSTTRKAGGTGLGLPISRKLVEMHGGRLWAESSGIPGDGTSFWIELPARQVESGGIEG